MSSQSQGVKEQALVLFSENRREMPDEAILPIRVVLDDASFEDVVALLETPPTPTPALRELLSGR
jgi:hypothetical protein